VNRNSNGLTLIETLVAIFLMALGVLAAAPMFIFAIQGNSIGSDYGAVGSMALDRMELLRAEPFESTVLAVGGDVETNWTNGAGRAYFDDTQQDLLTRWEIETHPTIPLARIVTVRAIQLTPSIGAAKEVTLTTIRAR